MSVVSITLTLYESLKGAMITFIVAMVMKFIFVEEYYQDHMIS